MTPMARSGWAESFGLAAVEALFAGVVGERGRSFELDASLVLAAEPAEQGGPDRSQRRVALQGRLIGELVNQREPLTRPLGHPDRDRTIQRDHRRGGQV